MPESGLTARDPALRTGLLRRLAAIFYDSLLLFALLVLATIPWLLYTGGKAVPPGNPLYTGSLLSVGLLYYGWFWTHGGQTLGLKTWRLRLRTLDGGAVGWRQATLRYFAALLSWLPMGAGYFWQWLDPGRLSWHDRLSGTVLQRETRDPHRTP